MSTAKLFTLETNDIMHGLVRRGKEFYFFNGLIGPVNYVRYIYRKNLINSKKTARAKRIQTGKL